MSQEDCVSVVSDRHQQFLSVSLLRELQQYSVPRHILLQAAVDLLAHSQIHRHAQTQLKGQGTVSLHQPTMGRESAHGGVELDVLFQKLLAVSGPSGSLQSCQRRAQWLEQLRVPHRDTKLDGETIQSETQCVDLVHVLSAEWRH